MIMKQNGKRKSLIYGIVILLLLWGGEVFLLPSGHGGAWWQRLKGFHLLLGVAGGLVLMGSAKAMGAFLLHRKESYYD